MAKSKTYSEAPKQSLYTIIIIIYFYILDYNNKHFLLSQKCDN